MADAGGDSTSLQFTPTWEVALVCFIIVCISIIVEEFFHRVGQHIRRKIKWLHLGALQKIKDELMVLGFISLLLAVFQSEIGKICISKQLSNIWLPCKKPDSSSFVANFTTSSFPSSGTQGRRLLAVASNATDYCSQKGKVAFLSVEAVHHLHIFIFALAILHVVLCLLKVLSMITQWQFLKKYEETINGDVKKALTEILERYKKPLGSFRFGWSVMMKVIALMSPDEYFTLRLNFKAACAPEDPGKEFQKYIMRTLQKEFEKMIGISWYLWLFVVIFLLVNVAGWHALFWISFIPLILLLIVHFKLRDMISKLVKAVAQNHLQNKEETSENAAKEMVVEISDNGFWFDCPRLISILIHFVLFENSLQLTFFFFLLFEFGFHSCIMGKVGFVIPRIAIGYFVQLLCTCRIIPLYAIMKSQMHLKEKQSDKQQIEKISMLWKENQLDECIKECLRDLEEIKTLLENEMDEEKAMWIGCILKWTDKAFLKWIDRGKKPSSPEETTNVEPTRTGSREGSDGFEITECGDMISAGDIEAQNRQPSPHHRSK